MFMKIEKDQKSVALVIGSGGVKCAAALGLWKTLQQADIDVSMAVGASGGSLFAAVIALGFDLQAAQRMTIDFWNNDLMEGYTSNLRAALSGEKHFTEFSGLINDQLVYERLANVFGEHTFAETQCPLFIVATDLYTGEEVILSSGRILDAVRASIAIPMIFSPWQVGDRWLVDGAASDPLPIDVTIREGGEPIVAMGFDLPVRSRMRSYAAVAGHFNSLYMNNILKASFAFHNLAAQSEVVLILPEFESEIWSFDGKMIPYVIEEGARATERQLPYIRRLIKAS
jgi:NTE family protein